MWTCISSSGKKKVIIDVNVNREGATTQSENRKSWKDFAPKRLSLTGGPRATAMPSSPAQCNTSQFNEIVIEELLSLFAVAIRDHKQKRAHDESHREQNKQFNVRPDPPAAAEPPTQLEYIFMKMLLPPPPLLLTMRRSYTYISWQTLLNLCKRFCSARLLLPFTRRDFELRKLAWVYSP